MSQPETRSRAELMYGVFQVLDPENDGLPPGEVTARVRELLPPSAADDAPYEGDSKASRYDRNIRYCGIGAVKSGWLSKLGHTWKLTPEGRAAYQAHSDAGTLWKAAQGGYKAWAAAQPPKAQGSTASVKTMTNQDQVVAVLDALPDDAWTAYSDVATVVGTNAQTIGNIVTALEHPKAHHVLSKSGRISAEFKWTDPARAGVSPIDLLKASGVEFDAKDRAVQSQRLEASDLRELLNIEEPQTGPRAWFVRGSSVRGHNVVPDWLADGFVSLSAGHLRGLEPGVSRDEVKAAVEDDYPHVSYNARDQRTTEFHLFLSRIREGDFVLAQDSGDLHLGVVTGPPGFVSSVDSRANLRRAVDWRTLDNPHDLIDLPQEVSARLATQLSIVDLTEFAEALAELAGAADDADSPESAAPPVEKELVLPAITDEFAQNLFIPTAWLQECVDLLHDRPQLVFYGPPGTGKTWIARKLAEHLAGAGVVKLVQFHPAYSYEDFFEGYRPRSGRDGQVGFELTAGPFRKLVDAARENPDLPHVLIIDEMNRANLARVFGELYFLLEYRAHNIDLMYSSGDDREFTLPKNVLIIGTMNTADRSIALVDAAMRRRFSFMALHPTQAPVVDVLAQWLVKEKCPPHAALLLAELNRRIQDPDFAVGPSYFMRKAVHADEGGLERTWRRSILPLLEEHHYGQGVDIETEYGFATVAAAVGLPVPDSAGDA